MEEQQRKAEEVKSVLKRIGTHHIENMYNLLNRPAILKTIKEFGWQEQIASTLKKDFNKILSLVGARCGVPVPASPGLWLDPSASNVANVEVNSIMGGEAVRNLGENMRIEELKARYPTPNAYEADPYRPLLSPNDPSKIWTAEQLFPKGNIRRYMPPGSQSFTGKQGGKSKTRRLRRKNRK